MNNNNFRKAIKYSIITTSALEKFDTLKLIPLAKLLLFRIFLILL